MLKAVQNEPYQYNVIVQLLLYTGMRRRELCGLEWQDVDFKTNCMHIQRNSLYIAEKGIFEDTPKNETSKRLGHANATTTSNIYLHAIQSADEAAAEILENIFAPMKRED